MEREAEKGQVDKTYRSSSPQNLLQPASGCFLQSQSPLTPTFLLVLPTSSEHPVSHMIRP